MTSERKRKWKKNFVQQNKIKLKIYIFKVQTFHKLIIQRNKCNQ